MPHGGETGVTLGSFLPSFGEEKEAIPAHTPRNKTFLADRRRDSGNFLRALSFQSRFLPPSVLFCAVLSSTFGL